MTKSTLQTTGMDVSGQAMRGNIRKFRLKARRRLSEAQFIVQVARTQAALRATLESFDGERKIAVLTVRTRKAVRALLTSIKEVFDPPVTPKRRHSRSSARGHQRPVTTVRVRPHFA